MFYFEILFLFEEHVFYLMLHCHLLCDCVFYDVILPCALYRRDADTYILGILGNRHDMGFEYVSLTINWPFHWKFGILAGCFL